MKTKTAANTHPATSNQNARIAKQIKLGIDVHADSYRVVRQLDNATPQPAQRFSPDEFLLWARKQTLLAEEVHSCYEAGPFGYGLHRHLEGLGIHNVVVRPQNWDELHKGVKTDKTDALALVLRLAMFVDGNRHALAVVRVPTPEEDLARSQSRLREQLVKHRLVIQAQGRSLLLYHGLRVKGPWWQGTAWDEITGQLPAELVSNLEVLRRLLNAVSVEATAATLALQEVASPQPIGVGALSSQVLQREVLDWNRFNNRRQVGSYTGLCPTVRQSGNHIATGSISRHGNRRLRVTLVEMAWRCLKFQPDYPPVRRRLKVLTNPHTTSATKKKLIVAVARNLAVDLWRIHTARTTAEARGLKYAMPSRSGRDHRSA